MALYFSSQTVIWWNNPANTHQIIGPTTYKTHTCENHPPPVKRLYNQGQSHTAGLNAPHEIPHPANAAAKTTHQIANP